MHQVASISLFLHPLGYCSGTPGQIDACRGYNFWSGIFSDITIFTGFVAVMLAWWRTHNCHVHGCYRLLWHTHPVHGHPVCKHHHPHRIIGDRVEGAPVEGAPGAEDPPPNQPGSL